VNVGTNIWIYSGENVRNIFSNTFSSSNRESRLDAYKDIGVRANKETEPNEGREHGVLIVCSAFLSVFSVVKNRRQATGHLLKIV